jgi:hypothetical protein
MGHNYIKIYPLLRIATTAALIVMTILTPLTISGLAVSVAHGQRNIDSADIITRGGGTGSISCPDGSLKQAVIAFVVFGNGSNSNMTTTNWNINELPSSQKLNPGFASGSFNSVDVSSSKFQITGQKINEVQFCKPPLSLPVTISGSCGQNVAISVQFQSSNPVLMTGGTFRGDVTCSQVGAGSK